jgi:Zn-dependent peptidase ImmA (M78 family)
VAKDDNNDEIMVADDQLDFVAKLMPMEILPEAEAIRFNVKMLTLAREAIGFSQKDLAKEIKCKQGRISKIEAGVLVPDRTELQKIVTVLKQNWDFFFQRGATSPASVSFYRKTQTMPLKMFRQCNAQMNVHRLQIEQQIGQKKLGKRELPYFPPEQNGGAKVVAQKLRREWGLKKGAVENLTKLVENTGCVIVDYSFPSAKLDGLCIRAPQKRPIIFLNKDLPKSRRRLSLAHELGHLVMHTNPNENVEDEAWDFAGEFLMPSAEIEKQFEGLNFDKLCQLKKQWGVSMQAILYRAKKLGKISESYYRFLWMQIGKCGYRVSEPFEDLIAEERPTKLEQRLKTET